MLHVNRLPSILINSFSPRAITSTLCVPTFRTFRTPHCILPQPLTARTLTMATASKVKLSTADCGEYHVAGITAESAAKASELLQENHDRFHIFYHKSGFHSTSSTLHVVPPMHLLCSPFAFLLSLQCLPILHLLCLAPPFPCKVMGDMAMLFRWTCRGFCLVNVH